MINVAIIGCGLWGPNILRNLTQVNGCTVRAVSDLNRARLENICQAFPSVLGEVDYRRLLDDPSIEAVVVATPARSHARIAKDALLADKHVMVEKPLAMSTAECEELIDLAAARGRVLMVGHTFLFNPAVRKVKDLIAAGELGRVYYLYSQRLNLGQVRPDVDAMWNLVPHDLSILLYLLDSAPVSVQAQGFSYLQDRLSDVVFLCLQFPGDIAAHVHASWLDPAKIRRLTIVGSAKMVVYDDVSLDAKVQIFDKHVEKITVPAGVETFGEFQLQIRSGDLTIPRVDAVEPLRVECTHFVNCVREGKAALSDGQNGLDVVRILEAAEESMNSGGIRIPLAPLPHRMPLTTGEVAGV